MKVASHLLAICLGVQSAAAATGRIYISDPPRHQSAEIRSVTAEVARSLLAQRASVEHYHDTDFTNPDVIQLINDFGSWTPLVEQERKQANAGNAFVLADGVAAKLDDTTHLKQYSYFEYSPAPDAAATRLLFVDLARQVHPLLSHALSDDEVLEKVSGLTNQPDTFYITQSQDELEKLLKELAKKGRKATVVVPPKAASSSSSDKTPSTWGIYAMPNAEQILHEHTRRQPEAPMDENVLTTLSSPSTGHALASNFSGPLVGILPGCFSSQSACETQTRNCTGHGRCYKKFTDADADDKSPAKNCYTCQCSSSVSVSDDGKKTTTVWGGPACQKKDVSTQFWLIALFTVGLMFLVTFAIGSILSMGNEELPSVIGAGVSGPVKK